MMEAISRAHAYAPAKTPVILYGETGVGKTFFAEYIHQLSRRSDGFHAFSVGNLEPQLAKDELFGHVPGAYTDARRMRPGRIASASAGTLLLDDLHTLDPGVQTKLLQVLDGKSYCAVGSDRPQTAACRFVLAMTDDPDTLTKKQKLLEDIRYRFGACDIWIPPLRERRMEIPFHAERTLQRCPEETGVDGPNAFTAAALQLLREGMYDGNVRQLEGIVLSAYLLARYQGAAEIDVGHFGTHLKPALRYRRHGDPEANRLVVARALQVTGGNVQKAAQLLGVSRNTVTGARRIRVRAAPSDHTRD